MALDHSFHLIYLILIDNRTILDGSQLQVYGIFIYFMLSLKLTK